jgi:hypothetical protein
MTGPSFNVDFIDFLYHSLGYALKSGTIKSYSSTETEGADVDLRTVIPGILIKPYELAKTDKDIVENNVPYCIFFHRQNAPHTNVLYGGAGTQELYWEIQAYCGSSGLRKRNALEGWLTTFLKDKIIKVYEFLYNDSTKVVTKSDEIIGYMSIHNVLAIDAAQATTIEDEEGRIIVNFTSRFNRVIPI